MVNKIKKKTKNLKFIVVGLDNAGKSTIINAYINKKELLPPTFGFRIIQAKCADYTINIYDIGGQSLFKKYWSNYFEKTDGIIFVIDGTDNRSYKSYIDEVIMLNLPILIFINKIDLIVKNKNITSEFNFEKIKTFEVSGIKNIGINEGFNWLVKECGKSSFII